MKTEIFVMTHKKCSLPNIPGYRRMQVGSALHEDLGYLRDDEGEDHISDLNVYYAELTGVYSLWRNLPDADYIGICHYRRYFINERKQIMVMGEFEKLLENADIVAAVADLDAPFQALYERAHYIEDLEAVGEAIQSLYPDDYPFFHEILQEKRCTYGNLCVMHRHLFEEYCTWLFDILSEAGENIDLGKFADDHQKKVFGFLGEPLLWVYIRARGLRMKECKAAFFDEKVETAELKNALRVLTREGRFGEALEMYKEVIQLRPDLVYRESDLNGELADMIDVIQKLDEESKLGKSDLYDLSHELDDLIHIDHKCCILVKGVLPILDYLADSYADGLKQSGYEVYFLDYQDFETSAKRILSLVSRKIDYVLAFNNVGFVLEKKDGTNLWEEKEIPAYNVLVDHPMYYADTLDNAPKNGVVLCADDSHPTYIARFYPSVGRSFFLPTGGTLKIAYEKQLIFAQRPIEFLMIGNYKHCEIPEDKETAEIYDLLKKQPERSLEEVVELSLTRKGIKIDDRELKKQIEKYRFITVELAASYREELVCILADAGYQVEIYGNGWEQSHCSGRNGINLHPPVSVIDGIRLMSNAKFVLNNMAWFKNGGSERVYNAMLQGALVISDHSGYLEQDYDEESIIWYDLNCICDILPRIERLIQASSEEIDRMRKKAYDITMQKNLWEHRVRTFLDIHNSQSKR